MRENKRNKKVLMLLILVIISLIVLVATFARYTGTAGTASDTAQVAKWKVVMDDINNNLFTHSYTKNILSTAGTDKVIAPGVEGEFEILLDNKGDVDATISEITFSEGTGNAAIPIQYSVDGTTWVSTIKDLNDKVKEKVASIVLKAGEEQTEGKGITVQWKWEIDGNNEIDTALGTASAEASNRTTYTLEMKVIATQVEPQK